MKALLGIVFGTFLFLGIWIWFGQLSFRPSIGGPQGVFSRSSLRRHFIAGRAFSISWFENLPPVEVLSRCSLRQHLIRRWRGFSSAGLKVYPQCRPGVCQLVWKSTPSAAPWFEPPRVFLSWFERLAPVPPRGLSAGLKVYPRCRPGVWAHAGFPQLVWNPHPRCRPGVWTHAGFPQLVWNSTPGAARGLNPRDVSSAGLKV